MPAVTQNIEELAAQIKANTLELYGPFAAAERSEWRRARRG